MLSAGEGAALPPAPPAGVNVDHFYSLAIDQKEPGRFFFPRSSAHPRYHMISSVLSEISFDSNSESIRVGLSISSLFNSARSADRIYILIASSPARDPHENSLGKLQINLISVHHTAGPSGLAEALLFPSSAPFCLLH